jgi:hypothetical protein
MHHLPQSSFAARAAGLAAAALIACGAAASAHADLVVTLERKSMRSEPPVVEAQKMSMSGDNLAATIQEHGQPMQMIWRGDKQTLYSLDPTAKTYFAIDKQMMSSVSEQTNAAMKQMQEQMAKMTPEQRAQMEKVMGSMPGMAGKSNALTFVVKPTGEKKTIQGYACSRYDVFLGDQRTSEMWVAPYDDVKMTKDDMTALRSMSAFFTEMIQSNPMLRDLATSGAFQGVDRIDGFPVLVRHFDGDKVIEEMSLKNVERGAVPASTFEVPAGFARKELGPKR